jgi:hypothetical protein
MQQFSRRSFAALIGVASLSLTVVAVPGEGAEIETPTIPSPSPKFWFARSHLCEGKLFWTKDGAGRHHVISSSKHWMETSEGWREMPWPEYGPGHARFLEEYSA